MIRTAKKLAACVLMLGVLVCGTALSAAAASLPVEEQNGVSLPWLKDVPAESISTGSYSANMLLGASQQLSPVVSPSYSTDSVVFLTDDSSVLTVSSSGVVQAVSFLRQGCPSCLSSFPLKWLSVRRRTAVFCHESS